MGLARAASCFDMIAVKNEGPGYSESSLTSGCVLAATIAGAMTIPMKARAIRRSCIRSLLARFQALFSRSFRRAVGLFSRKATRQTPVAWQQTGVLQHACQMHHRRDESFLEIPRKVAGNTKVLGFIFHIVCADGTALTVRAERLFVKPAPDLPLQAQLIPIAVRFSFANAISIPARPDSQAELPTSRRTPRPGTGGRESLLDP